MCDKNFVKRQILGAQKKIANLIQLEQRVVCMQENLQNIFEYECVEPWKSDKTDDDGKRRFMKNLKLADGSPSRGEHRKSKVWEKCHKLCDDKKNERKVGWFEALETVISY